MESVMDKPDNAESGKPGHWVYCRYITKNGRRIYPKNGKFFRFWKED
jgi:hypothetical protein